MIVLTLAKSLVKEFYEAYMTEQDLTALNIMLTKLNKDVKKKLNQKKALRELTIQAQEQGLYD